MNVFESAVDIAKRSARRLSLDTFEDRTLAVRISNGTRATLKAKEPICVAAGKCTLSFQELLPGQTGTIRFYSSGGGIVGNATSGCHHAGAIEFQLDSMRLLLGESCPFCQSTFLKSNRFVVSFDHGADRSLEDFYAEMPATFMGSSTGSCTVKHAEFTARVNAISTESPAAVDVVLLHEDLNQVEFELDSLQQLQFAEWCRHRPEFAPCGGSVLFLAELRAVTQALRHKKICPEDKAFTLDLLIETFVTSGLCNVPAESLGMNLARWREMRRAWNEELVSDNTLEYRLYANTKRQSTADLEACVEEASMLLRTAALQCMWTLSSAIAACKAAGDWPDRGPLREKGARLSGSECRSSVLSSPEISDESPCKASPQNTPRCHSSGFSTETGTTSSYFGSVLRRTSSRSVESAVFGNQELLLSLLRKGIHASADHALRRTELLEWLKAQQTSEDVQAALATYCANLPLAQRSISAHDSDGSPEEVIFHSFSSEVFQNLKAGVGPLQVLESLGHETPEYRKMSTNSKSGELFLFSHDRRFIIKTLTAKELLLLTRMMPAYQNHIQDFPRSLIVRYAGLFHVQWANGQSIYFMLMRSVFDPEFKIHETFDLKGSLYHRKKKENESVGKDEDWLSAGHRLRLPAAVQREFAAQHELDAQLLRRFKMMDYSILLGIHHVDESAHFLPGWQESGGIVAQDGSAMYFIGIIDFSIKYSLKKQAENLLRVAQGKGEKASCVSADAYAERQVRFLQDKVIAYTPGASDVGTVGRLCVDVVEANNLVAADWTGTSDPYVRIKLGLFCRQTHTIPMNCNPAWNSSLYLPVNDVHISEDIEVTVWDEDQLKSLRGNDDYLGRVSVSMASVLCGPADMPNVKLEDTKHGTISLRCKFEPLRNGSADSDKTASEGDTLFST